MSVWSDRACWTQTAWTAEQTARLTGLKQDTIYHYVSRKDPKFPQPRTEGGRIHFTAEQVLRFILEHRPRRSHTVVPRLFPRIPEPTPAQFVRAEQVSVADVGRFAVHSWQPSDGGRQVAIAYPDRENTVHINNAAAMPGALLDQLPARIEAVAVPNGEAASLYSSTEPTQTAPLVVVAERNPVYRHDPVGHGAARYRWWDLANLLRVDIPWWSPLLNELDAMLAWRPGTPITHVTPYAPTADTGYIAALAAPTDSAALRTAIDKLTTRILMQLNGPRPHDDNYLTPGLTQAAISTLNTSQPVPELTADEAAQILHHRVDKRAANQALRVANHWAFMPVLTYAIRIQPRSAGSMALRWIARLTDVTPDRRTELGFWFIANYYGDRVQPVRWLRDPYNPNTWIIHGDNDTIYAGVGTHMPAATGKLTDAEIDDEAAFFRDSAGQIWPLPDTGYHYYRTGYDGAGPQRLAETLTLLLRDATIDVHKPPHFNPGTKLYQLLSQQEPPITLTAEFLANHPH